MCIKELVQSHNISVTTRVVEDYLSISFADPKEIGIPLLCNDGNRYDGFRVKQLFGETFQETEHRCWEMILNLLEGLDHLDFKNEHRHTKLRLDDASRTPPTSSTQYQDNVLVIGDRDQEFAFVDAYTPPSMQHWYEDPSLYHLLQHWFLENGMELHATANAPQKFNVLTNAHHYVQETDVRLVLKHGSHVCKTCFRLDEEGEYETHMDYSTSIDVAPDLVSPLNLWGAFLSELVEEVSGCTSLRICINSVKSIEVPLKSLKISFMTDIR